MTDTTMDLPVKLNDTELRQRAKELGDAHIDKTLVESRKKAANDGFKMEIEQLDTKIQKLSGVTSRGEEYRPIAITTRKDFDRSIVETIRLDTNEVVDSRPMTGDELQAELFNREESQEHEDERAEKRGKKRGGKKADAEVPFAE